MIRFIWAWLVYTWGGLHRYFGNANNMPMEHERAIYYFARAYKIDPTFHEARLQRAILLFRELRRPDEALAEFDALLKDDPEYGRVLFNRGLLLHELGRYQESLASLDAYIQLPERDDYWEEASRLASLLREITNETP
ncbi:MAG: tetratricopeptide repeat protein [Chloroflexi bacterium]|nr:tetratricopeptide repeat protein [Chloroflexota bacterium]